MPDRTLATFPLRRVFAALAAVATAVTFGSALAAPSTDVASRASYDTSTALVQLNGEPLATSPKSRPAAGRKIDFNNSAVKSYRAQLAAMRNDYKAWLRNNVPAAKVTGEFDLALNAVAVQLSGGATLSQVAASPLVAHAEYQGVYRPTIADPDLGLIDAETAWTSGGGAALAGAGVKVAIVDTGIDVGHPCFADAGYPSQQKLGPPALTNNKVIVAKVFNNKSTTKKYTPAAVQDHGTHVAGTVACNHGTAATVSGVAIPYGISGVAPRALLGNYNVFPADVEDARDEDILNALEAAYADGFDVANMSLGGGVHGFQDLLTHAVDNLDVANMVVAVAAGNSGPGLLTVESPGSAARALTAGASSVPHFVGAPVLAGGSAYGAASGEFAVVAADLTASLGVVLNGTALDTACAALPAGSLAGKIALVARGTCLFTVKVRNVQAAGAVAVLVGNNVAGDPTAMATDGTPDQPTIPAYMVSRDTGAALKSAGSGTSTTIGQALAYFLTPNSNIMAGFSSQGPTDVDFRVKPDVVAPGVNVLSSIPASFCATPPCFAFFSGTSMATPHLAGSAAVVRQQHPTWSAAQVRSAIVNTAMRDVLRDFSAGLPTNEIPVTGAGLENLANAVGSPIALDPVSIGFGALPAGSGQTRRLTATVTNLSGAGVSWTLGVSASTGGVTYSVSPSNLTLAAGASADVVVTMNAEKGAVGGGHSAWLDVRQGGTSIAHAAVYGVVK